MAFGTEPTHPCSGVMWGDDKKHFPCLPRSPPTLSLTILSLEALSPLNQIPLGGASVTHSYLMLNE